MPPNPYSPWLVVCPDGAAKQNWPPVPTHPTLPSGLMEFFSTMQQNMTGSPVPTHSALPPGLTEFFSMFTQNGTLPPFAGQTLVSPTPPMPHMDVPPPTEGRSFT